MSEGESSARDRGPMEAIAFGQRFAESETFKVLFREGMSLVEETAGYLDGDGRRDAKGLPRMASLAYATESMRLTTRLMQLASWLLLQRAANEGDMSPEKVRSEKSKIRLKGFETDLSGSSFENLPPALQDLVRRSLRLQERIQRLDLAIHRADVPPPADNPVGRQIGRLAEAFGHSRLD